MAKIAEIDSTNEQIRHLTRLLIAVIEKQGGEVKITKEQYTQASSILTMAAPGEDAVCVFSGDKAIQMQKFLSQEQTDAEKH